MESAALQILQNITTNLTPWWDVLTLAAYFLGFAMVVFGLVEMAAQKQGMMRGGLELKVPLMAIIVGLVLLNLMPFLNALGMSTFGSESAQVLSYQGASGATEQQQIMLRFAVYVTMLVGLASVLRGLYMLYSSSHDPRGFWPAVTHVFGGFFAVNIISFMDMIGSTAGGTIQTTIQTLVTG
jgi:hypothetical protein